MDSKKLNIQVAEIVLGQVPCKHWRFLAMGLAGWGYERLPDCPHGENRCYYAGGPDVAGIKDDPFTPHYGDNHEAAFSLVDMVCRANDKKPSFVLARNYTTGRYRAEFLWGTEILGAGEGAKAPEAICRAAIETKRSRP